MKPIVCYAPAKCRWWSLVAILLSFLKNSVFFFVCFGGMNSTNLGDKVIHSMTLLQLFSFLMYLAFIIFIYWMERVLLKLCWRPVVN